MSLVALEVWWLVEWNNHLNDISEGLTVCVDTDYARFHLLLTLLFFGCAIGLFFRNALALYFSILNVATSLFMSAKWMVIYYRDPNVEWAECLGHVHVFNVCGFTSWDAVMLGLALALLAWQVRAIINALFVERVSS